MFGIFGGAAAVTAEAAPQKKGRFPQKDRFRHKTGLGFYDFAWSGWNQIYNQSICCAQWWAVPVDPRGAPWARQNQRWARTDRAYDPKRPYGFYSSTTGTAGPWLSPSYVVDTTLITGHPLITIYSTPKQKADSRFESYDRLMKMIEDFAAAPSGAVIPLNEPPMKYYARKAATTGDWKADALKPGDLIPVEEMIAKFKMK